MRKLPLFGACLVGFAVAVVPALGKDESATANPDNTFSPKTFTIDVGDTITISNSGGGFHNVHWDDRASAEEPVSPTWTTSRKLDAPGTYRFYCDQHGGPGGAGMSAVVTVRAPGDSTSGTTTQTQTQTTTTTSPPPPADTTPTTTSTAPGPSPAAADTRAPSLAARAGSLRRRIQLAFTVNERARIVAVIRGAGLRTTVRFVLVPGHRTRVLLRNAKPGRYTLTLTATDEAGNRARTVRKIVRVRR